MGWVGAATDTRVVVVVVVGGVGGVAPFLRRAHLSLWTDNVLARVRFFLRCSQFEHHMRCLAAIY